ncbi:MAG: CCA tRNA nucleotidyltransferase [Pseudomonadota bacterium]
MIAKIPEAEWLAAPETREVMAALNGARPGGSRFVGGCVRNTLMDRPVDDIDIATQLTPEEVLTVLKAAGIRAVPTGIDHGTITAIANHVPFEITTLRRDVETDGRRAVVAFTEDWAEDAMRRDFRLNALYAEPDGTLHDPTGGGVSDAASGKIVFIGDADTRLKEDYLRILRFFRFNAWYGTAIDRVGLAACDRQKTGLSQIAVERIWKELKKLLAAPDPQFAIGAMVKIGILEDVLQAVDGIAVLRTLLYLEREARLGTDPLRRLMAFLPKDTSDITAVAVRLKLSNAEKDRLIGWAAADDRFVTDLSGPRMRQALYRLGRETLIDTLLLTTAGAGGPDIDVSLAGLAEVQGMERPKFPVEGQDLLNAGFKPGPIVGDILGELETLWVESDFRLTQRDLLETLEDHLKQD